MSLSYKKKRDLNVIQMHLKISSFRLPCDRSVVLLINKYSEKHLKHQMTAL